MAASDKGSISDHQSSTGGDDVALEKSEEEKAEEDAKKDEMARKK